MKTSTLTAFLIGLLATATAATADLVMVQETAVGEATSRTTLSISGDRIRTDSGSGTSVIIDTKSGQMTTLMHEQKMVITLDVKQLQAAAAPATPDAPAKTKITATGKKKQIQGYACEQYLAENGDTTVSLWVAKDYPNYDVLKKQLAGLEKMNTSGFKQPEVPGMALQTEYTAKGLTFVTTVVSLQETTVDPSIFEVPAGYKAPGE